MRPVRSLLVYFVVVFIGGALLAPWLYWLANVLAAHSPAWQNLASNPFHRFVNRAMLGLAIVCLWPLWRSCGMLRPRDLGLRAGKRGLADIALGFLLGFGSLACVALAAVFMKGRAMGASHSNADIFRHVWHAALAAIIVAFIEELVFRGTLFGILRKAGPWPMALVISSAVYAVVHFLQDPGLSGPIRWWSGLVVLSSMIPAGSRFIPAALTLFMAGTGLALAYQRTGALFFSMGLHCGWIFWLKSYGFLTTEAPGANAAIWGTGKLIDGWVALLVVGVVCWIVSRMKTRNVSI